MIVTIFMITGFYGTSRECRLVQILNRVQDLHSGIKKY